MADAVVIEFGHCTAGIAVRERSGYRFFASDIMFRRLDAHKYRHLRGLRAALRDHLRDRAPSDVAALAGRGFSAWEILAEQAGAW